MKINFWKTIFAASLLFVFCLGITSISAQEKQPEKPSQKAAASKTAKFETVSKTDALYKNALDAHDLAAAQKLIGKDAAFKGTVAKIFETRNGETLILNFDRDFKTALNAVLKNADFSKFPDMNSLDGKEIVVSGKFIDFHGKAEIELTDPKQIAVVK